MRIPRNLTLRNVMRNVKSGLVILTGPLCLAALVQTSSAQSDYVDLEAEAAAREAAGTAAPADPYAAQPAQSYPATSYGIDSAPAGTATAPATATSPAQPQGAGGLGNLVLQVQQLQQEVMRLNGKVEEQANELRMLKEQNLQRYMDLDKRLSEGGAPSAGAAGPASGNTTQAAVVTAPAAGAQSGGAVQPGEKAAYDAAYALVTGRQFSQAVPAFQQFLRDFPDGRYAPNAHYWLGELYLVIEPPDLESSRQSFALLISEYPDHSKTPDALYKLGKVQFMKGNREKAREYLDLVISQYGTSNTAVVKLAQDFIAENY